MSQDFIYPSRRADWGRRKISDVGDVAPPNRTRGDQDGDLRPLDTKTVERRKNNCCDLAKAAVREATMALAQTGQAAANLVSIVNQARQNTCGGPCSATLIIDVRKITIARKRPKPGSQVGEITTQQGEKGQGVGSVKVGTRKRCYNSALMAKAAAQALIAARTQRNANYEFEVGKIYEFGPQLVSPDLGLKPGTGQPCPEPAFADRKQIGVDDNITDRGTGWGDQ